MSTDVRPPAGIGEAATRRQVVAWGLWDWGSAAFNAVILTFVFSVYLTDAVGEDLPGSISASTWLGWSLGIAGFLIACSHPSPDSDSTPQGDANGRSASSPARRSAVMAAMFFVRTLPVPVARAGAARPSVR